MKKNTQKEVVRRKLLEDGEITNVWAVQNHILRLSERCRELQAAGMDIAGERVKMDGHTTGIYRYTLKGGPKPKLVATVVVKDGVRMMRMVQERSGADVLEATS